MNGGYDGCASTLHPQRSVRSVLHNTVSTQFISVALCAAQSRGASATRQLLQLLPDCEQKSGVAPGRVGVRRALRWTIAAGNRSSRNPARRFNPHMHLLRDQAILDLSPPQRRGHHEQLQAGTQPLQCRATGTRTDVAQARSPPRRRAVLIARRAGELCDLAGQYRRGHRRRSGPASRPARRSIGCRQPRSIMPSPKMARQGPSVLAAMYGVDIAERQVKSAKSALYPNLSMVASASKNWIRSTTSASGHRPRSSAN